MLKAFINVFWIAGTIAITLLAQPLEAKETVETRENIVCLSASGNGYNWSATLTWAAEILKDAVVKAPDDAKFNVSCVSGASSSSAFIAVYGSLLQNQQLFPRKDFNSQSITKIEARILAKSLLYMALAGDFNATVASFYTISDGNQQTNPPWWASQYSLERVMLDFGTRVMLAQHISLKEVEQVEQLEQFVRYYSLNELAEAAKNRKIRQKYRQVTNQIWQSSQVAIARLYQDAKYSREERQKDRDDFRNNPNHPVRRALAKHPADGVMALTYAELAFTKFTSDYKKMRSQPPSVDDIVPFVFTNETTAKQIINSSFYRSRITQNDPYAKDYVICVVSDYYTMLLHGIREPELMPAGIYRLSPFIPEAIDDLGAGVSWFYQPITAEKWQTKPQFQLIRSTRTWFKNGESYNARMGIAGGWVDSYISGQANLYLGSSYAGAKSNSYLYFSTLSRQNSVTGFARNVINKYFAPQNPEQAIAKIEKHRNHFPRLIELYQQYDDNHTISWQPIFVDWGVPFFLENQNLLIGIVNGINNIITLGSSHIPVAITQQSNYLLTRTINTVRYALGTGEDRGYIYDRAFNPKSYELISKKGRK